MTLLKANAMILCLPVSAYLDQPKLNVYMVRLCNVRFCFTYVASRLVIKLLILIFCIMFLHVRVLFIRNAN